MSRRPGYIFDTNTSSARFSFVARFLVVHSTPQYPEVISYSLPARLSHRWR